MEKISEIKIEVLTDGKHEYTRALIYDDKRKEWREFTTAADGDVHVLLVCADDIRRKYNAGTLKLKRRD